MPELSRFYGIIIRMYLEVGGQHHRPHFHAYYGDDVAIYSLSPIELIAGSLPRRQARFAEAWAELHEAELLADWNLLQGGQTPVAIARFEKTMIHPIYRVTQFQIVAPYTLRVGFDDGTAQTIDFEPVLSGQLFGPLRDLSLFGAVQLDAEVHTLTWPNGADFDPATLHDWPTHVEELIARAREWELAPA